MLYLFGAWVPVPQSHHSLTLYALVAAALYDWVVFKIIVYLRSKELLFVPQWLLHRFARHTMSTRQMAIHSFAAIGRGARVNSHPIRYEYSRSFSVHDCRNYHCKSIKNRKPARPTHEIGRASV